MERLAIITYDKYVDSYEDGELDYIVGWEEQEFNPDFSDWQWNGDDNVYEKSTLVDDEDVKLSPDEVDAWRKGMMAYTINARAQVFDLVRVKTDVK